ncbi:resuscitation-promoting factor, partial [Streptomyces sp. SID14478]|nr:resuscitation-promoting factor [Streptomyces sp. SID14478]
MSSSPYETYETYQPYGNGVSYEPYPQGPHEPAAEGYDTYRPAYEYERADRGAERVTLATAGTEARLPRQSQGR